MNNNDYPEGADNSLAPWNQSEQNPIFVDVTVSETLSRTVKIPVTDYSGECEMDEDGFVVDNYDFSNTDFENEYYSRFYSIEALLEKIGNFLFYLQHKYQFKISDVNLVQDLIDSCLGWTENEREVICE